MFTGIIEQLVKITEINIDSIDVAENKRNKSLKKSEKNINNLSIKKFSDTLKLGDSVAINGCCLTISKIDNNQITFDLLDQTLKITNLKTLKTSSVVNAEEAMKMGDNIGGHMIQGHIDTTSKIISLRKQKSDYSLKIAIPKKVDYDVTQESIDNGNTSDSNLLDFKNYLVKRGSISINGISLTIADIIEKSDDSESYFVIYITPYTYENTNLKYSKEGDLVNIEFDILGKYIVDNMEKYLSKK